MPVVCFSESKFYFPSLSNADPEGLLLIGGQVTPERVLEAYPKGIFPWYTDDGPPMWWSPDPRFVLYPEKLKVSHSMKATLNKGVFEYRFNTAFEDVIRGCASVRRNYAAGTWISDEMMTAYTKLHEMGFAFSAEAWQDGELAGGLYGVRIRKMFFGESMFSRVSNASKAAFIHLVRDLHADGVKLIDCQMHTAHLESLGAEALSRESFLMALRDAIK